MICVVGSRKQARSGVLYTPGKIIFGPKIKSGLKLSYMLRNVSPQKIISDSRTAFTEFQTKI